MRGVIVRDNRCLLIVHQGVGGWFRFTGTQQCVDSRFRCLGDFEIMDFGTLNLGACSLL